MSVIGIDSWLLLSLPYATLTPAFAPGRPLFVHAPSVNTM